MTHETTCRECGEDITITYEIDAGEPRTWMYPGSVDQACVEKIDGCDCEQDEEGYDQELMEAADDAEEAWHDARADAARDRMLDR